MWCFCTAAACSCGKFYKRWLLCVLLPTAHCTTICPNQFLQGSPVNIDWVTEWLFQDMQKEPSVYVTRSSVVFADKLLTSKQIQGLPICQIWPLIRCQVALRPFSNAQRKWTNSQFGRRNKCGRSLDRLSVLSLVARVDVCDLIGGFCVPTSRLCYQSLRKHAKLKYSLQTTTRNFYSGL